MALADGTLAECAILVAQVLTKRGKKLQKHYTVYLCEVTPEARAAYEPRLNEEHSKWAWYSTKELRQRTDVHPVVHALMHAHWTETSTALSLPTE